MKWDAPSVAVFSATSALVRDNKLIRPWTFSPFLSFAGVHRARVDCYAETPAIMIITVIIIVSGLWFCV